MITLVIAGNINERARMVVGEQHAPLASISGKIYALKPKGWTDVSNEVQRDCNTISGKNNTQLYAYISSNFALPTTVGEDFCQYYEWKYPNERDYFIGEWVPYHLEQWEVLFSDGKLNLKTLEFTEHKEIRGEENKYYFWKPIWGAIIPFEYSGVELKKHIKAIDWERLDDSNPYHFNLRHIQRNLDTEKTSNQITEKFLEFMAFCLISHFQWKKEIYLIGESNTLKTTIARMFAYSIAGVGGTSEVTQAEIIRDKWGSINLVNKLINISDDSEDVSKRWTDFMKRYTSGVFTIESKYGKPQAIPATAKFIHCSNIPPTQQDPSLAGKNRHVEFEFNKPLSKTTINQISSSQYLSPSFWVNNIDLRNEIIGNLIYILHQDFQTNSFLNAPEFDRQQEEVALELDETEQDILSLLDSDPSEFTSTRELLNLLNYRLSARALSSYIKRLFPGVKHRTVRIGSSGVRGYQGLKVKNLMSS